MISDPPSELSCQPIHQHCHSGNFSGIKHDRDCIEIFNGPKRLRPSLFSNCPPYLNFIPPGEKYKEDVEESEIEEILQMQAEKARIVAKNQTRIRRSANKLPNNNENTKEIPKDPTYEILKDVMRDIKVTLAKDTSPSVVDCFSRLGCSIVQVLINYQAV